MMALRVSVQLRNVLRVMEGTFVIVVLILVPTGPIVLGSSVVPVDAWSDIMMRLSATGIGCYQSRYPSAEWIQVPCTLAAAATPAQVGSGVDYNGQAPSGNTIGLVSSHFSVTGFSSESDSKLGSNYYSVQVNSPRYATYYNQVPTILWEQFMFVNNPGYNGGSGFVEIQYWLVNYYGTYHNCNAGGGMGWTPVGNDCWAVPVVQNTTLMNPSILNKVNFGGSTNLLGSSYDRATMCDLRSGGQCFTVQWFSSVFNLYQWWSNTEVNVLGYGNLSQSNFNSGTSITVSLAVASPSNTYFNVTCNGGGTSGETNSLTLNPGSCTGVYGGYSFNEH